MSKNVLVVGSINVDYVIETDRLPKLGETIEGKRFSMNFGGKGANQAVALARAGCCVTMLGAVGEDLPGELAIKNLESCGVSCAGVDRVAGPTGAAVITVCGGDNHIILDAGANGKVTPERIAEREALIAAADVIVMQYEIPMESILATAKMARKHGKRVILNPAPAKGADRELYSYVDLLIPNEFEAEQITGVAITDRAAAKKAMDSLRALGVGEVLVTLGKHGSAYLSEGELRFAGIYPVTAVDSTAAGDSFIGGLCAKLCEGADMTESVAYASAVSAIAVSRHGAGVSIPTAAETEAFLQNHTVTPCTLPEGRSAMALPEIPFYLFGMGRREKFIYKNGALRTLDGEVRAAFSVREESIFPDEYRVELTLTDGSSVALWEDEDGVFLCQNGEVTCLTEGKLNLPRFDGHPYARQLRVLLQETLFNITTDGRPLPNIFVYDKPWYRDSAMIAMVLKKTGNIDLIRDFVLGMNECYDRNNAGHCEPDNLGQALYLISTVSDRHHPLVPRLVEEARSLWTDAGMPGLIDFNEHPVYSAKWLKYGLSALGMDHSWVKIPAIPDNYSTLFWMAYRDEHVEVTRRDYDALYPYLWWAEKHFAQEPVPASCLEIQYPMTNETQASQAKYEGIRVLSEKYADAKNASPHTWHSAEMFLYLWEAI